MKKIILIILFLFLLIHLNAQNFIFEKITTRKGLSQNDVNCIFQDHSGFLWVGTNDGLNRYDGYNFKTFRVDNANRINNGLTSNLIFRIKEDKKGNLWIATSNEGVCKFNVETEHFTAIRNTAESPSLLSDNRVIDLVCMEDGSVWAATLKGVNIIEEKDGKFNVKLLKSEQNTGIESAICNRIAVDSQNRIWVGATDHLFICEKSDKGFNISLVPEFEHENIKSILPVSDNIIIATNSSVYFIKNTLNKIDNFEISKIDDLNCSDILLDENNNLFLSTNQGFTVYDYPINGAISFKKTNHYQFGRTESELNSNIVTCLYKDVTGIIWIGTNGGGLNKYNPKRKNFRHYRSTGFSGSLSQNNVQSIYQDSEQNIWVSTLGGGLNYLDHSKNRNFQSGFIDISLGSNIMENNVHSFLEFDVGGIKKIWAGAGYPMKLVEIEFGSNKKPIRKSLNIPEIKNSVYSLLKDREGDIWLGTYGSNGLFRYTRKGAGYHITNFKSTRNINDLSSNTIRSLLQDSKGNLWIGTDNGLNVVSSLELKKEKPKFKVYKNDPNKNNSLSNNYILPLFESKDGDLWVGTMGGGLNKINYTDNLDSVTFTSYDTQDGLPNNVIKGILEDENRFLWISSNKGLTRFNPKDKTLINYDISDGLQDFEFGEFACCKLNDGMMVFGGVNGLNTFYPEQIVRDMTTPYVVFTDLQILNQSVEVGEKIHKRIVLDKVINHTKKIKLKYSENSFAIYFSALHFSAPSKNKYKYILEGFDTDWIKKNSDERFAKYTNLKPGNYKFKLMASSNDGVWSDTARQLEITVVPPWWQSNLAYVIYIFLFVYMLWFFQRYSIIRIKQKNELIMEHFEKEKIEELSQMKLQFFTNISHEFRTPLTLITGSIDNLVKINHKLPIEFQKKIPVIQRNAGLLLRLINQLIDFRKFEQGKTQLAVSQENIVILIEDISFSFSELAIGKGIKYSFNPPTKEINLWFDAEKIEKIIYNLLSNAFKFTSTGGEIDVELEEFQDHVAIRVKDTGVGIPEEMQVHIFERFYQATKIKQNGLSGTGTGIGLSFSKGLANLHQGDILFHSKEGEGSCFEVILRKGNSHFKPADLVINQKIGIVDKKNNPVELLSVDTTGYDPAESEGNGKPKLLIVEDNLELRLFLSESFTDNYQVILADNGEEGLKMALEHDPDLIISDIMMPVKDGFELCHDIKTNIQCSHIPIVLLTAKTSNEDTIQGYENGADAYVSKPFQLDVLMAQVKSLIRIRRDLKTKFRKSIDVIPSEVTSTSMDEEFLGKLLGIIEDNISKPEFSVEQLASHYGITTVNLNKKLKSLTGFTTTNFIRNIRLKRAAQLLETGKYLVTDVTYEVGFQDLKHFRTIFKEEFGISPSKYLKKSTTDQNI